MPDLGTGHLCACGYNKETQALERLADKLGLASQIDAIDRLACQRPESFARIVAQFSCGAASAVATKLALAQHGDRCVIVNAYVKNEHPDNRIVLRIQTQTNIRVENKLRKKR